jgi:hypothetical protein
MCFKQIKIHPWYLIHSICFIAFAIHLFILGQIQINPPQTETLMEVRKLENVEFPVNFKICFKPGLNITKAKKFGYESVSRYFKGCSMYNESVIGWAGHTEDGAVLSTPEGRQKQKTKN